MQDVYLLLGFVVVGADGAQLSEYEQSAPMHVAGADCNLFQVLLPTATPTQILLQEVAPPDPVHLHILVPHQQLRSIYSPTATPNRCTVLYFTQQPAWLHAPHFDHTLAVSTRQQFISLVEYHVLHRVVMVQHDALRLVLQAAGIQCVLEGLVYLYQSIDTSQRNILSLVGHADAGHSCIFCVPQDLLCFGNQLLYFGFDGVALALQHRIGQIGHNDSFASFELQCGGDEGEQPATFHLLVGLVEDPAHDVLLALEGGWLMVHCFLLRMLTDVLYPQAPLSIVTELGCQALFVHKMGSLECVFINEVIKDEFVQIKQSFLW